MHASGFESAVRDAFDHWLAAAPQQALRLLDWSVDRAEERLRRRLEKEVSRKTATRIWREINLVNLHENILPTRARAHLVMHKRRGHSVDLIRLRTV